METSKLFRNPLTDSKWDVPGEISLVYSPDEKYKIAFSHFFETRMNSYEGLFNLLDKDDNVIDGFEPLTTFSSQKYCWNDKSNIFTVAITDFGYGYFFAQVLDLKISFIKIANPYPLNIHFANHTFVISYDDYQLSLTNSTATFGGGPLEIPSKMYLKPKDIEIPGEDIIFYPREKLKDFGELTQSHTQYRLDPIDGGFREFQGVFPENTKQVYNSRQLEVYQLEAFAEYGDAQSQEWLNAIKDKTNGNYSKWQKVEDYIGFQKRSSRWRKY
jgi:hypothetical protein